MKKIRLSKQAEEIVRKLINSKDTERAGYIAAIDPETGEVFYGRTEREAAQEGRSVKRNSKAVFFFVRVGYPSVHVLKTINLHGYIHQLSVYSS